MKKGISERLDDAGLFQDPEGRAVPCKRHHEDSRELVRLNGVLRHRLERLGHDAAAPEYFPEPVANLCRDPFDIVMKDETDATHGQAIHYNGKPRLRDLSQRGPDEVPGILARVRRGEGVTKVPPDLSVVGVDG
jgi:hypothetical protein